MNWSKKVLYFLVFIFTITYLVWRTFFTLPFGEGWFAMTFGVLLLISEIVSSFTGVLLIWSKHKEKAVVKPDIPLSRYPDVDVFIATHNEEVPLLHKTVNACVHMRYPDKNKVHIYLSDDTNRPEVKALADKFGVGYVTLTNNKHAKSGNLNNALNHTNSPLVATFDADMIPYSDFLMETVPYFLETPEGEKPVGLVQTPQSFYNADVFQYNLFAERVIPNEQDFFSREVNVLNNAHDAAVYTGSNTMILRRAIEQAGGFPTDTVTEDFELGALINMQGYRNISTLEPMASGLTPTDIPSVMKQRIRWARGVIQSVRNLKLWTNKQLTIAQKMIFLNSYLYWWSFARRLLFITAPILFTVFDIKVVEADFWILLMIWLPRHLLLNQAMQVVSSDIRTQRWGEIQETIFAPYMVIPVLLESIGIKEQKFKVTNKAASRSKKEILYILPHLILLVLTIIGLIRFNYGKYGSEMIYGSVVTFWLLVHLFNLLFAVLFFIGRPLHRKDERFMSHNKIVVRDADQEYVLVTKDVSEGGLSFLSPTPLYFEEDRQLEFVVTRLQYEARMKGRVVRVAEEDDQWVFGVQLEELSEADYNQYLQIIYDGFNKNLPQSRDPLTTTLDCLLDNIDRRVNQTRTQLAASKFATLSLNQEVRIRWYHATVRSFNYHTMTIVGPRNMPDEDIFVHIDDVPFHLTLITKQAKNRYVYQVENLADIIHTQSFRLLLQRWAIEEENTNDFNSFAY